MSGILVALCTVAAWAVPRRTIVEVSPVDSARLDLLSKQGFDIDTRRGTQVRIFATDAQLETLRGMGLNCTVKGYDPSPVPIPPGAKALGVYHDFASMTVQLQQWAADYPEICRLQSLGNSVQGRTLWAMRITDHPDTKEEEPEFKYVGAIHGIENDALELCLYFIDRLLTGYAGETRIQNLVDTTDIWVVPSMNPDGLEAHTRYNASGRDLNRSFPAYPYDFTGTLFDTTELWTGYPAEVQVIGEWTLAHRFVLSANLHTGEVVINYPYDDDRLGSVNSPTPDDALMQDLSRRYTHASAALWNNPYFTDGITNGAEWYSMRGGMQDWNYRFAGCIEVTDEVSYPQWPDTSDLAALWAEHEEPMLAYLEAVHIGVRGRVTDAVSGAPVLARVRVAGNSQPVFSGPELGDYYRLLLPGVYTLTVDAPGYQTQTVNDVTVVDGAVTRVDVALIAESAEGVVEGETQAAEGEVTEGEGEIVEGEPVLEGELIEGEGEGSVEGERPVEGAAEGAVEGQEEGEASLEGENVGEGLFEGAQEGAAEGDVGPALPKCGVGDNTPVSGEFAAWVLLAAALWLGRNRNRATR